MPHETSREEVEEPQRKGRSNAILTYETVEAINLGIQAAHLKLDNLTERVAGQQRTHDDHEVRLRVLEKSSAASDASRGTGAWVFNSLWPIAGVLIALLSYLNNPN